MWSLLVVVLLLVSFLMRGGAFLPFGLSIAKMNSALHDVLPSPRSFQLHAFGVQRLGEKVAAEAPTSSESETEVPGTFRRVKTPGVSGCDERFEHVFDRGLYTDEEAATLVNIDKALRQQSLLMTLGETSVLGNVDKAVRVKQAAKSGLLPPSLDPDAMLGAQLKSGGLFKDWEFDM